MVDDDEATWKFVRRLSSSGRFMPEIESVFFGTSRKKKTAQSHSLRVSEERDACGVESHRSFISSIFATLQKVVTLFCRGRNTPFHCQDLSANRADNISPAHREICKLILSYVRLGKRVNWRRRSERREAYFSFLDTPANTSNRLIRDLMVLSESVEERSAIFTIHSTSASVSEQRKAFYSPR